MFKSLFSVFFSVFGVRRRGDQDEMYQFDKTCEIKAQPF